MRLRIIPNLLVGVTVLVGIVYLTRTEPMPYHKAYLELDFQALPLTVQDFIMGLIHLIGWSFICLGVVLYQQSRKAQLDGGQAYRNFLLSVMFFMLLPLQYFTLKVGHSSPWWAISIIILLCASEIIAQKRKVVVARQRQCNRACANKCKARKLTNSNENAVKLTNINKKAAQFTNISQNVATPPEPNQFSVM